jgi:ClpP class serine protease
VAHPNTSTAERPKRATWRESPAGEALAFDRWRFSGALGGEPGEARVVRPGAFGLTFAVPQAGGFLAWEGKPREGALLDGGIAVVCAEGPLEHHGGDCSWWANYDAILKDIETALMWPGVQALVLKLDTPGGVCAGMLSTHRAIRALRAKHGKPIVGYVDELAASAGYGLASACDEIWLPPEAVVGSIGVILCTVDESEHLKKEGIAVRYVVTGARKADLHPGAALTDEVLAVAQSKVDELGVAFFATVGTARGMKPVAIAALEAAVFMGESAVAAGLADGVADWAEFLGTLRGTLGATVAAGTLGTQMKVDPTMATKMQAQQAKEKAAVAVTTAQAALAAAKGDAAIERAEAALATALASKIEAAKEMAKVTHRMKHEEVTVETPDSEEKPAASEAPATAKSEPPAAAVESTDEAPASSEEPVAAAKSGKLEKAAATLPKGWATATSAYRTRAVGVDAYGIHSPAALFQAAAKATGQTTVPGILGALAALPARLAEAEKVGARVAKLEKNDRAQRIDAIIAAAKPTGKIGGKAHREHLRAEGLKNGSVWLRGHLAVAPVVLRTVAGGGLEAREGDDGAGTFTGAEDDEQKKLLAMITAGMPPEEKATFTADFAANLAAKKSKTPKV